MLTVSCLALVDDIGDVAGMLLVFRAGLCIDIGEATRFVCQPSASDTTSTFFWLQVILLSCLTVLYTHVHFWH